MSITGKIPSELDSGTVAALQTALSVPDISSDELAAISGAATPSASNVFATIADVPEGGAGVTEVLYSELLALIGTSALTEGAFYRITDFATSHWMVDGSSNYIHNPSPAPTGITITPDAVGSNPHSLFYKVFYELVGEGTVRSKGTAEIEVSVGDSTTEIIIDGDVLPEWATGLVVWKGTETGVYTDYKECDLEDDIISTWTKSSYYTFITGTLFHFETDKVVNTGTAEPLIVLATSENTISREAYSASFPQDIIYYEWDIAKFAPDNWYYDGDVSGSRIVGTA